VGDRRVWTAAGLVAVPLLVLLVVWCAVPRAYFTGTDSAEDLSFVAPTGKGAAMCLPAARVPADTAIVRLRLISATTVRPALRLTLRLAGRTISSTLPPLALPANRIANADFPIPSRPSRPQVSQGRMCVTAKGVVNWAGTPLPTPGVSGPTVAGAPISAKIAVWYLPRAGAKLSYFQRLGAILRRAALFRPGIVGGWTYALLLFLLLPAIALLALRTLAVAAGGSGRRLGLAVFAIAAVNACCWALITPPFQAPDEVDHFAYTQALVERGHTPSPDPGSPLLRWSSSEGLALDAMSFPGDHQLGDTRPPWLMAEQREYESRRTHTHPQGGDGGGYTTSAVHGPLYYYALAPAYLLTRHASVFSQLTLMRLTSALLGALVALFTFLLARELAPGRPWLAVLAGLLVAYEPMYGFVSGIVNNDVGVNAAAAALELLLIRLLRRGITIPWGLLTGAVLLALPNIKGTGLSLFPVAALVFLGALWRHHRRRDLVAWVALGLAALAVELLATHLLGSLRPPSAAGGSGSAIGSNASAVSEALHDIPGYLS
jgi:hypothetical protein